MKEHHAAYDTLRFAIHVATWKSAVAGLLPCINSVRVGRVDSAHSSSLLDITYNNAQLITTDPFVERILSYQKAHDLVSS